VFFGRKPAAPEPVGDDEFDDEERGDEADWEAIDEWQRLDLGQDWREDGPFDIDEVDLEADDITRLDMGALIVTPEDGLTIRLVKDSATDQILYVIAEDVGKSAAQIAVIAAPADDDHRAEIRAGLIAATPDAKVTQLAKGPFGTEIRRVISVTDDRGRESFVPMRDWLIAGPRWVLDVRLSGRAAIDPDDEDAVALLEEFVRNLIVRRGDVAMAPGSLLPLDAGQAAGA